MESPQPITVAPGGVKSGAAVPAAARCHHCGTPCPARAFALGDKSFCCAGCRTVFEILSQHDLTHYYELDDAPGITLRSQPGAGVYSYLDDEAVRLRLLDFTDGRTSRVTFRIPAMHCVACVWLLENLFRIQPGIGRSLVNFSRKQVTITFEPQRLCLSRVAEVLASLGYEPELNLSGLDRKPVDPSARRHHLQVGLAGFSFGNIMLLSIPFYLGLDSAESPAFARMFTWTSLLLAIPVVVYSASDYWRAAWLGLRRRILTIDFPIALGLAALLLQSLHEILSGRGPGYLDSLTGLIFFLLCGRIFQRKTYDRLSFDRDYRSYFPLAVVRREADGDHNVPLTLLDRGDRILVRNREIVPADSVLMKGKGLIDYSFVTGESDPVPVSVGDYIYAGGRQVGAAIELQTVRAVESSQLASLWRDDASARGRKAGLQSLTDKVSRVFTGVVVALALVAAAAWWGHSVPTAVRAFTSVLIVACPCALALSAPFALGSALRVLGRKGFYARDAHTLETLARITLIVFDKTGTLTPSDLTGVSFHGPPLRSDEENWVGILARQSSHPHSRRIARRYGRDPDFVEVDGYREELGRGIAGESDGHPLCLGTASWLQAHRVKLPTQLPDGDGPVAHLAIDGHYRGHFALPADYRADVPSVLGLLSRRYRTALLSGDNAREAHRLQGWLGPESDLRFEQSPRQKLEYVRARQDSGERVMMIGDGLNDAGALRQSDVGIALAEHTGAFSPASDVIAEAATLARLPAILAFTRMTLAVIIASFILSFLYNAIGLGFAVAGRLSPLVSAILMPLSSISVVAFATLTTNWFGRRLLEERA